MKIKLLMLNSLAKNWAQKLTVLFFVKQRLMLNTNALAQSIKY